jgi:phosphatidylglycerophosphatase A
MNAARLVATLGGLGRLPAPGSWGSAAVLPAALLGPLPCLALALGFVAAGFWAGGRVLDGKDDPAWFVADEAAGMLLALAALPEAGWLGVLIAFALFRLFDIAKPWPVSWADAQPGVMGVMLDDLLAGLYAALVILGLRWLGVPM